MSNEFKPQHLPVQAFAAAGASISGAHLLSKMERLAQDLRQEGPDWPLSTVRWQLSGEEREVLGGVAQIWLHLQASAALPLSCQRCLELAQIPVELDRWFRFVPSEKIAEAEDDEAEEDLLVLTRQFDALALLEDELLMALPMVPKHAVCPGPVKLAVADADFDSVETQKPHPFAALAGLAGAKKGPKG